MRITRDIVKNIKETHFEIVQLCRDFLEDPVPTTEAFLG